MHHFGMLGGMFKRTRPGILLLMPVAALTLVGVNRPLSADANRDAVAADFWQGRWAFSLPDGNPAWLNLDRENQSWVGRLLWSVGSARRVADLQVDSAQLSFQRQLQWKPFGEDAQAQRIDKPFVATRAGEQLRLTFEQTSVTDSTKSATVTLLGDRMPPMPPRPDLTTVQLGSPISLFNGKNLDGWRLSNAKKRNGWRVDDGVLVNESPKKDFGGYGDFGNLRTIAAFSDFELTIEYNAPVRGNSGIYLRGMYEAQVVDRDSPMQGLAGPGAIFGRIKPTANAGLPGGQWNRYVLTLVDRHITVVLNGQKVIDNQPVHGCTGGGISADDTQPGPILLQGDHTSVKYRNIVLRPVIKASASRTFQADLDFLREHTDTILLSDGGAHVVVAPEMQGRVMTSTAEGLDGASYGWINQQLIASGKTQPHINAFGGEDRFWLGPEGGQFSIFFQAADPFDLEHWQTPAPIDTEAYRVVDRSERHAQFVHDVELTNYSGTAFSVQIDRTVRILDRDTIAAHLSLEEPTGEQLSRLRMVAFESSNVIQNTGTNAWSAETGLLSIWILGMFSPSDTTTIILPIRPGSDAQLGAPVNADYFGRVPSDRLRIKRNAVFFRGDGKYRSKIGTSPARARPICGSYDSSKQLLTLVQFTLPTGATDYVNSAWELQDQPYRGDVVNSYNDGPPAAGEKPLGPFYELESSSPAAALQPGQRMRHVHRTFHLTGDVKTLDFVARAVLGVALEEATF